MKKYKLTKLMSLSFVAGLVTPALFSLFVSLSWKWFWWNYFTMQSIGEKFAE